MSGPTTPVYARPVIVPTMTPQVDPTPVIQTVATRQYGRWAPQFRYVNVSTAAARDVALKRSGEQLGALQELHDRGLLSREEFTRLAAQV